MLRGAGYDVRPRNELTSPPVTLVNFSTLEDSDIVGGSVGVSRERRVVTVEYVLTPRVSAAP